MTEKPDPRRPGCVVGASIGGRQAPPRREQSSPDDEAFRREVALEKGRLELEEITKRLSG